MAFTATNHLKSSQVTTLRDQQHAAKLFNADQFRLAPKSAFLFHVSFGINPNALRVAALAQRYRNEINMLVKSVDLPGYKLSTEMLNQYNRKKVVQFTHSPDDTKIKFHDDNMGLINQLWQNYYTYYYADPTSAMSSTAYSRNATRNSNFITAPYGLDNGSTVPFFNYIKIYQMARHEYISYHLVNPIITKFNHNKVDYADTKPHDFDMTLQCESIAYGSGVVTEGDPEGFGFIDHYDITPSPLSGTNPDPTVTDPSFVKSFDTTGLSVSAINNAVASVNTYQNTSSGSGSSAVSLLGGIAAGVGAISAIGAIFPGAANAIGSAISGIGGAIGGVVDSVTGAVSSGIDAVSQAVTPSVVDAAPGTGFGDDGEEYTTDSLGNTYQNGELYRAAEVPEDISSVDTGAGEEAWDF